jgi:hypothetical protein
MQLFLVISQKMEMTVFDYNKLHLFILFKYRQCLFKCWPIKHKNQLQLSEEKKRILISIAHTSTDVSIDPQKSRNNSDHVTNKISHCKLRDK